MNSKRIIVKSGAAVNYFEKRNFKVDADYIKYANDIKPDLLRVAKHDQYYATAALKILEALTYAIFQAQGRDVLTQFKRACREFDNVVAAMNGGGS